MGAANPFAFVLFPPALQNIAICPAWRVSINAGICATSGRLARASRRDHERRLGSEEFCGLDYDQAAIQAFITKRVPADDMDFPPMLESMTTGTEVGNQTKSNSAKTAHCAQIARIAKSYGFTRPLA
jgi:hypothetical protein